LAATMAWSRSLKPSKATRSLPTWPWPEASARRSQLLWPRCSKAPSV